MDVGGLPSDQLIRFGVFELDVRAGVLSKRGARLAVQGLPLQVLALLLEKPGNVVTRDEIRARLWPADTFVDFDHGLHNAIARLREALGDSATAPRFVETLPRRGYRFIGTVDNAPTNGRVPVSLGESGGNVSPSAIKSHKQLALAHRLRPLWLWVVTLLVCAAAIVAVFLVRRAPTNTPPVLHQITFRRGTVWNARFTPDGNSVIYGAAWDGNPIEVFEGRLDSTEGRPFGLPTADVLAISGTGELAVLLNRKRGPSGFNFHGMLARLPLTGGTPRLVMDKVEAADWGPRPDTPLAVTYHQGGKARLEYPVGTLLYESATWLSDVRVSPKGDMVAFVEHDEPIGDSGVVRVVGSHGNRQLTHDYGGVQGLAWSPTGSEIWYTAAESGGSARNLHAVDLVGHDRMLYRVPGALRLQDVAKDGRVLFVHELIRAGILAHVPGESSERELGWLDWSIHRALSKDGKWLVFDETGDASGGDSWTYLRATDGSAAVKLGSGSYSDLSPDGKWVAVVASDLSGQVSLLPTGEGQSRTIRFPSFHAYSVSWSLDGKHLVLSASDAGKGSRLYLVDLDTEALRPISPEGSGTHVSPVSPDGSLISARGADGNTWLFPIAGGTPRKVPGLQEGETVRAWTSDGKAVYVGGIAEMESVISLVDLATGKRRRFQTVGPLDKTGLTYVSPPNFTPDGKYYAYSYNRQISELFVADGIK
jgi:DNA-binding winged helix-turn-helix (wHTH) protein/Tol biopolymer transport system component